MHRILALPSANKRAICFNLLSGEELIILQFALFSLFSETNDALVVRGTLFFVYSPPTARQVMFQLLQTQRMILRHSLLIHI